MRIAKPQTIEHYRRWLRQALDTAISNVTKNHYDLTVGQIERTFSTSPLWTDIIKHLPVWDDEFLVLTGYPLLVTKGNAELCLKPFDSLLLKSFRHNVLNNPRWPKEPEKGWVLPNNWLTKINDIVRTMFTVKYLDGVTFLAERICSVSETHNIDHRFDLEAKEEGYYAAHVYVFPRVEVSTQSWTRETLNLSIEIQITTQLQEVIRKLLHNHYEARRKLAAAPSLKWQWDYRSDEFAANYLGHILHYVEGMIMDVREKQAEGPNEKQVR